MFSFTSLNLFLSVRATLRVNANSDRYPNLVAGISNFNRGQRTLGKHVMQNPPPSGGVSVDLLEVVIDWCLH